MPGTGGGGGRMVMHGRPGPGGGYGAGAKGGFNQRKGSMGRGDHDEMGGGRPGALTKELAFFDKVKQRLRSREAYQDFLKCLNLFANEIISRQELMHLANDIIGRYPDLMAGFHQFLARCETMESFDQELKAIAGAFGGWGRGHASNAAGGLVGECIRQPASQPFGLGVTGQQLAAWLACCSCICSQVLHALLLMPPALILPLPFPAAQVTPRWAPRTWPSSRATARVRSS